MAPPPRPFSKTGGMGSKVSLLPRGAGCNNSAGLTLVRSVGSWPFNGLPDSCCPGSRALTRLWPMQPRLVRPQRNSRGPEAKSPLLESLVLAQRTAR